MKQVCIGAAILLVGMGASAQSAPEAAVLDYLRIASAEGFAETVDLLHPDAKSSLKESILPIFRDLQPPARRLFIEDLFGPGVTMDDVSNMPSGDFVRRVLEYAAEGMPVGFTLEAGIIGAVSEGDLRHVLVRASLGEGRGQLTVMQIVTVQEYKGRWMVMLGAEGAGVEQLLRSDAAYYRNARP